MEQTDYIARARQLDVPQQRQTISQTSYLAESAERLRQAVERRYGREGASLLAEYNADFIMRKHIGMEECHFGEYPTLAELDAKAGGRLSAAWLMAQLHDLSEYCGCRDKLEGHALRQCASIIATDFDYLKVTEVLLFLHRFKSGRYGRFYGSIDPMVITTALREFLNERLYVLRQRQQRQDEIERQRRRSECVTWEQYRSMTEARLRNEGKNAEADKWSERRNPLLGIELNEIKQKGQ